MEYKKVKLGDWLRSLADLRRCGKRPFNSKLEESRVSFDLSVIPKGEPAKDNTCTTTPQ